MKRFLALLLALIMALGCLALSSCNNGEEKTSAKPSAEHTHSGGTPTCKDKAVCADCGKAYGELASHSYGTDGKCTVCGAEKTDEGENGDNSTPLAELEAKLKALAQFNTVTEDNYRDAKAKYTLANDEYSALPAESKELISTEAKQCMNTLRGLIFAYEEKLRVEDPVAFYYIRRELLPTVRTVKATVNVDGELDSDILKDCTPMTLNKALCDAWSKEIRNDGAGVFGDVTLIKDADTNVSFYIVYDDENLYVIEQRSDLTWNFTANDFNQSYTGDGSILWFVNVSNADKWLANGGIDNGSEPACGMMWSAGTRREAAGENSPMVAYFPNDNQTSPHEKLVFNEWDSALKWNSDTSTYVLEVAIPWSDLPFSAHDIESGNIASTFCSVDIVNPEFDGNSGKLWGDMGYQMQYPGCTKWCWSQSLVVKK